MTRGATHWTCRGYTRAESEAARPAAEAARCEAELRAGNPDVLGALRGLVDWSLEAARMDAEQCPTFQRKYVVSGE